jgi:adenylate cyclase
MNAADIDRIADWLVRQGLEGTDESELLNQFGARCNEAGLPLARALVLIDTLHPVNEGRLFRWRTDGLTEEAVTDYGPSNEGAGAEMWRRSPFFHLLQTGGEELRRRIGFGDALDFDVVKEMKEQGYTDYFLFVHRIAKGNAIGEMDCVCSAWSTRDPAGFSEACATALRRLVPILGLAVKSGALARIASTLVEVYLGRDAGRRVLEGRIQRGVADRIGAALWFSDLRGYTSITDSASPSEVIPLLNDYADAVISSIHEAGGDVLKLMGDGTLAIFTGDEAAESCRRALQAERSLRKRLVDVNARRKAEGRPVTDVYLGMHIGEVFYGNIGSVDRLDFTVVGPAVNEVSRIASMCRSVDRTAVMSADFRAATPEPERNTLVSVGRYALRGVGRAQELFTIDPELT